MFVIEMFTRGGPVCESFATLEEARRRLAALPIESLRGLPLLFEQLPDGSERLVRDDGKPLQWHRSEEGDSADADVALPVHEALPSAKIEHLPPVPEFGEPIDAWDDPR